MNNIYLIKWIKLGPEKRTFITTLTAVTWLTEATRKPSWWRKHFIRNVGKLAVVTDRIGDVLLVSRFSLFPKKLVLSILRRFRMLLNNAPKSDCRIILSRWSSVLSHPQWIQSVVRLNLNRRTTRPKLFIWCYIRISFPNPKGSAEPPLTLAILSSIYSIAGSWSAHSTHSWSCANH